MEDVNEEFDGKRPFKLRTWKAILAYALPFKGRFALVAGMMIVVAGIDAFSPFITGWVVDNVVIPGNDGLLPAFALFYAALIAVQAVTVRLFIGQAGVIETGMNYAIRKACFARLQTLSFSYYDRTGSGWIMARVTSDTGKLADIIAWGIVDLVWGSTMMAGMAALMLLRDWRLGLLTLSVVPPLVVASLFVERSLLERSRAVRKTNSRLTQAFAEGIRGARTVKSLAAEDAETGAFRSLSRVMKRAALRQGLLSAAYIPLVMALGYVGTSLALWKGGVDVLGGTLSYGTVVAFVFAALSFFDPATDLARILADFQYAQASAERVIGLVDTEPSIVDGETARAFADSFAERGEGLPRLRGRVEFERVSFSYGGGQEVLRDFSLLVEPGRTIALVGETGSGKSTIVNLACRFYEPTSGRVLVDGRDYRDYPLSFLHGHLGYVLQQPYLFSGSVGENIRYGRLDATDDEVVEASRRARAHDFISLLEKGYDTEAGEGGALLSTGQKQLVSIARAMLADPALLVLDEATSSVDTETESLVQEAIREVLKGRTSFVVAHRLSTIVEADLILVLRDGVAVERGTHRELTALGGYYSRLYRAQFLEEREEAFLRAGA